MTPPLKQMTLLAVALCSRRFSVGEYMIVIPIDGRCETELVPSKWKRAIGFDGSSPWSSATKGSDVLDACAKSPTFWMLHGCILGRLCCRCACWGDFLQVSHGRKYPNPPKALQASIRHLHQSDFTHKWPRGLDSLLNKLTAYETRKHLWSTSPAATARFNDEDGCCSGVGQDISLNVSETSASFELDWPH